MSNEVKQVGDSAEWTCMDSTHGEEGFTWVSKSGQTKGPATSRRGTTGRSQSVVSDIGEKLLSCIPPGPEHVPYVTVEDRFFELWPEDADALLQKYGHMWRNEGVRTGRYTMSMYLAHRLSNLERQGLAEHVNAKPDPMFNYHLTEYSWWRLPQETPTQDD
jgi:hypothetical protein